VCHVVITKRGERQLSWTGKKKPEASQADWAPPMQRDAWIARVSWRHNSSSWGLSILASVICGPFPAESTSALYGLSVLVLLSPESLDKQDSRVILSRGWCAVGWRILWPYNYDYGDTAWGKRRQVSAWKKSVGGKKLGSQAILFSLNEALLPNCRRWWGWTTVEKTTTAN
jgi:hypothetical protein